MVWYGMILTNARGGKSGLQLRKGVGVNVNVF